MSESPTLTELGDGARALAMACYDAVLRPHLEHGVPLTIAAEAAGPNEIWRADHTPLDLWAAIERAVCGRRHTRMETWSC